MACLKAHNCAKVHCVPESIGFTQLPLLLTTNLVKLSGDRLCLGRSLDANSMQRCHVLTRRFIFASNDRHLNIDRRGIETKRDIENVPRSQKRGKGKVATNAREARTKCLQVFFELEAENSRSEESRSQSAADEELDHDIVTKYLRQLTAHELNSKPEQELGVANPNLQRATTCQRRSKD